MLQGQRNGPKELQCHPGALAAGLICLLPAPSGPPWQDSRLDLPLAGPYVLPALQGLQATGAGQKDEKANSFLRAKEGTTHPPVPCSPRWKL